MPASVYIETTIPSYYVARRSQSLLLFTKQELTREWWRSERHKFDLYTSALVLEEAGEGDAVKAAERLSLLDHVPLLDLDDDIAEVAAEIVERGLVPEVAARDAIHLAAAGTHQLDYLLTWNCKHLANPHLFERLRTCFAGLGVHLPVICTPEQLFEDED